MSKDGFNAEDISSTFARFDNKRRNIVGDESKLERKKPEPIEFSSATNSCGSSVLKRFASLLPTSVEQNTISDIEGVFGGERYQSGIKVDN